jgi:cation diffusion facilitator CzcD-associated flavoprotein CzcO
VVVIGAGMAGILAAVKLRSAGIDDVTIYEKGDSFGGTWRENSYPGLACDVPSHLYCYSFAPNPEWSHRFSPGPEIKAYFEGVARRHHLDAITRLGEEIVACELVDGRWSIETSLGHHDTVDVVIAATGVLHHPNVPRFAGLESFRGVAFHSARWRHDVLYERQRVGIVGTGSTAVQITGAIVDDVARLSLFQRTPQWIMPQSNPAYSEDVKHEFRLDPTAMARKRAEYSKLFSDGISNSLVDAGSPEMHMLEAMCRENLETSVSDPTFESGCAPSTARRASAS